MNEKPNNIWKKPFHLPQLFLAWLCLMVVTILIFTGVMLILNEPVIKSHEVFGLDFHPLALLPAEFQAVSFCLRVSGHVDCAVLRRGRLARLAHVEPVQT